MDSPWFTASLGSSNGCPWHIQLLTSSFTAICSPWLEHPSACCGVVLQSKRVRSGTLLKSGHARIQSEKWVRDLGTFNLLPLCCFSSKQACVCSSQQSLGFLHLWNFSPVGFQPAKWIHSPSVGPQGLSAQYVIHATYYPGRISKLWYSPPLLCHLVGALDPISSLLPLPTWLCVVLSYSFVV